MSIIINQPFKYIFEPLNSTNVVSCFFELNCTTICQTISDYLSLMISSPKQVQHASTIQRTQYLRQAREGLPTDLETRSVKLNN